MAKKTLACATDHAKIVERIASLTPASQRLWGSMSVGGMVCHLCDAYRVPLGETAVDPVKVPIPRSVMKFIALDLPMRWPKSVQTPVEVRQGGGGTVPGEFVADRVRLLESLERFRACMSLSRVEHAFFGSMSNADWMRWGYLHADHHLRQFSA